MDATLAKRVTKEPLGGDYGIQGYDKGLWFTFEQREARDVADFGQQLRRLSQDTSAAVLRGALTSIVIAAKPTAAFRRKYADPDPAKNALLPMPRAWFAVDADDVAAPPGMDWMQDVPAAALHLVSLLPPELHGVSFIAQLTGSAGFSGAGLMRLRLWFVLTDAVGDKELRRWANAWNVRAGTHLIDPTIYNPAQLHYTARPILGPGVIDPTGGRRWYGVRGSADRATLSIPPEAAKAGPCMAPGVHGQALPTGFDQWIRLIGDTLHGFWKPMNGAFGAGVAAGLGEPQIVAEIRSAVLAAHPGHRTKERIAHYADVTFLIREVSTIGRRDAAQRQQITVLREQIFTPRKK